MWEGVPHDGAPFVVPSAFVSDHAGAGRQLVHQKNEGRFPEPRRAGPCAGLFRPLEIIPQGHGGFRNGILDLPRDAFHSFHERPCGGFDGSRSVGPFSFWFCGRCDPFCLSSGLGPFFHGARGFGHRHDLRRHGLQPGDDAFFSRGTGASSFFFRFGFSRQDFVAGRHGGAFFSRILGASPVFYQSGVRRASDRDHRRKRKDPCG